MRSKFMSKLLTTFLMSMLFLVFVSSTHSQNSQSYGFKYIGDAIVGNTPNSQPYIGPPINYVDPKYPLVFTDTTGLLIIYLDEVNIAARTIYDLQSNGVIHYIEQGFFTGVTLTRAASLYACFMVALQPNPWDDRRVKYFYSPDTGTTWLPYGNVQNVRGGFPGITVLSDGRGVIAYHTTDGGTQQLRTQIFTEPVPGQANFVKVDPGVTAPTGTGPIWPSLVTTSNAGNTNKVVFIGSISIATNDPIDTAFTNAATNLNPPGGFTGYTYLPKCESANQYAFARANNGNIGMAYIVNDWPGNAAGSVEFRESTDNGATWGAAVVVFNANIAIDSIGALRSIDIVYLGNIPKVFFGLGRRLVGGFFQPGLPSKQVCWTGPGGQSITVDSAAGLNGSNPTNDVFYSVCRGVVGASADGNALYAAWNRSRLDTSTMGNNYFDVYFAYSTNGGLTWVRKTRVTNPNPPTLRDCRYVAISSANHFTTTGLHYAHLIYQQDSVPGSGVNGAPNSLARMMYARIRTTDPIGVKNISSEIPREYALMQNYPNPFNPATTIRFALPKDSRVTLKVYDLMGREVATLVSNAMLNSGLKEIKFDGSNIASGIYLYSIKAGDFTDTKKMVLIK